MKNATSNQDPNFRFTRRRVLAGLISAPVVLSAKKATAATSEKPAADSPDVIIVGAGAIGCNTAWHLRKRGLKVLVLEAQEASASQSTNGAAGFVASWSAIHVGHWKKTEWEMQRYGIDFYTKLAKRTQADIGFSPCGISYIYITPKGWKGVQKRIALAREYGTTVEVLSDKRAKELMPFIEFEHVSGIAFDPDAVRVRAGDAIRALAKELAEDGVQFRYSMPLTNLLRDGDQIVGVRTADGEIRSKKVIVTAGAWSRPLLAKLDIKCPSSPFNETRYVSKPLPGLNPGMPLLIFTDHRGHYIREEQGGLLIGGGDNHPLPADRAVDADNPPWVNKLPQDQAYRTREFMKEITNVMPVLDKADIASIRSGLPTRTADSNFIAGPVPGIGGLFVMSGCQEAGVTHGPALGRILCEYAVDGKTEWDSSGFRFDRFAS